MNLLYEVFDCDKIHYTQRSLVLNTTVDGMVYALTGAEAVLPAKAVMTVSINNRHEYDKFYCWIGEDDTIHPVAYRLGQGVSERLFVLSPAGIKPARLCDLVNYAGIIDEYGCENAGRMPTVEACAAYWDNEYDAIGWLTYALSEGYRDHLKDGGQFPLTQFALAKSLIKPVHATRLNLTREKDAVLVYPMLTENTLTQLTKMVGRGDDLYYPMNEAIRPGAHQLAHESELETHKVVSQVVGSWQFNMSDEMFFHNAKAVLEYRQIVNQRVDDTFKIKQGE